ncbi:hypothetical protein H9L21_06670 [Aeromicrobium senzhongii]|uniref:Uncharacterized protein n=1 Tax=Aeromicrobium senzhongii TaxID=2663859 RepID=A0ABX6SVZ5_9ACTN|nr:hypothetical protein [Aeromicrobium senzhongii]MTB87354.1 hypothetical protein [Aeromicrobium senzhongii]QNL95584.1 hypothetical protein H9L21_06670 [Aeromicrobium senzhongii]
MTPLERLDRWTAHGGTCRLVEQSSGRAEVVLCRCDGGEEVERFTTCDPTVMAWVRDHSA